MAVAFTAPAGIKIEFERRGIAHRIDGRRNRLFCKQRATEIGMQYRACEVEQRPQIGLFQITEAADERGEHTRLIGNLGAGLHRFPDIDKHAPQLVGHHDAAMALDQRRN
ncbi:hypothetical protein D3C73_451070 [compost metagenome]